MKKAARSKNTSLASAGAVGTRRKAQAFRRNVLLAVVAFFALVAASIWWGISRLQTTESRSQASVDQSFRLQLVSDGDSWEVVLAAHSPQASVRRVSAELSYPQEAGDLSVSGLTFQAEVSRPQPGTLTFSGEFLEAPKGEVVLMRLTPQAPIEESRSSLWTLSNPSIRGILADNPGIEVELFNPDQKTPEPEETQCVVTVKKCPQGSALTTTSQYPCGACLDPTGAAVGPTPPSPVLRAR